MGRDISIMVSARDRYGDTIRSMTASTQAFGRSADGLNERLNSLNRAYGPLESDVRQLQRTMREAQQEYERLGDSASRAALETASADFAQGRGNLQAVSREIRQTQRSITSLETEGRRISNSSGGILGGALNDLRNSASWSMLTNMAGTAVAGAVGTGINSALGSTVGSAVNTILSSTVSGAAMGMLAGAPGAAIGAGIGAVSGGVQAATQYFEKEDDEFRSVRQSEYDRVKQLQQADLTAGTGIAAQRQTDKIAFSNLLGGENIADEFLGDIKDMANTTPFLYEDLKSMSKVLSTYGYSPDKITKKLLQIGDTGANLGLQTSDMSMIATYLGRMNSTDKTTMEYLNPLMERGVKATDYLAEALGKSKKEITEMVSKGLIPGAEAAEIIADAMGRDNSGAMAAMSQTYSGLLSTVEGLKQERQNAMGGGYTNERSKGLQDQVNYFDKDGERIDEVYRLIGVNKATVENQQDEKMRSAQLAAVEQIEQEKAALYAEIDARADLRDYEKAQEKIRRESELGAKAATLMAAAESEGKQAYLETDGYATQEAAEIELLHKLSQGLKDNYYLFGQNMKREFNKGLAAEASLKELAPPSVYNYDARYGGSVESLMSGAEPEKKTPKESHTGVSGRSVDNSFATTPGKAFGMAYVPRDDTAYRLHEGERVLTAQENREYSGKSAGNIVIHMNGPVVREETDVEAVARAIAEKIVRACDLL